MVVTPYVSWYPVTHGDFENPRTRNPIPARINNPAMAYGQIAAGAQTMPIPMKDQEGPDKEQWSRSRLPAAGTHPPGIS